MKTDYSTQFYQNAVAYKPDMNAMINTSYGHAQGPCVHTGTETCLWVLGGPKNHSVSKNSEILQARFSNDHF